MMTRTKVTVHGFHKTYALGRTSYCPSLLCCYAPPVDLNDNRQSGREHVNKRHGDYGLKSRPARSIPRPRGEASRKSVNSNGGHHILKHGSNVDSGLMSFYVSIGADGADQGIPIGRCIA